MPKRNDVSRHIVLTSHPSNFRPKPIPIQWRVAYHIEHGPIIATLTKQGHRNVIGTQSGSYAIYRALAVANPLSIKFVCLLAAPKGIKYFCDVHPDVPLYTAAIDDHLDEHGYIIPGLGDACNRLFGTK
jgi:uracil phosphoribosyltransferase